MNATDLERIAELVFVHSASRCSPDEAFTRAQHFIDYRETQRRERRAFYEGNGHIEGHRFEPAQGNNSLCLACGRDREVHV